MTARTSRPMTAMRSSRADGARPGSLGRAGSDGSEAAALGRCGWAEGRRRVLPRVAAAGGPGSAARRVAAGARRPFHKTNAAPSPARSRQGRAR